MMTSLPRFRSDLELRRQSTPDGTMVLVDDPVSGACFRLHEFGYYIARQLDGATPVEVIWSRIGERLRSSLRPGSLDEFVRALGRNGLLEQGGSARNRRRITPFSFQVRLFDPDRYFSALAPRLGWCFTPASIGVSAGLVLAAAVLAVLHATDMLRETARLAHFSTLPIAILAICVGAGLRETARAVACTRHGGHVRELGLRVSGAVPTIYCEVSDAWLFPEKPSRLCVRLAGPFIELAAWAGATCAWSVTDPATSLHRLALIMMVTSGVRTLIALNPLLRLDGYHLLSDWLNVSNLQRKSFGYLRELLRRLARGGGGTASAYAPREKRILLAYGMAASVAFLCGGVGLAAGALLLEPEMRGAIVAIVRWLPLPLQVGR
jgi:putative peptide zinc metalloprotease protein